MLRKSTRLWHQRCGKWKQGSRLPNQDSRHSVQCEAAVWDDEFSSGECVAGSSKVDIEGQDAIQRSLSKAFTEKRRLAKKCKQEGEGL